MFILKDVQKVLTFPGHMSVSVRILLASASPPMSEKPNFPGEFRRAFQREDGRTEDKTSSRDDTEEAVKKRKEKNSTDDFPVITKEYLLQVTPVQVVNLERKVQHGYAFFLPNHL